MHSYLLETLESRRMFSASTPIMAPFESAPAVVPAIRASVRAAKPPTARLRAQPITTALTSYSFNVIYHSSVNINASTITTGGLTVSGPQGYSRTPVLVSVSPAANAKTIVAVYTLPPPSGTTFTASGNGVYVVTLAARAVSDINNVSSATPARVGIFRSQIKNLAPTPSLAATTMTSAISSYSFQVVYHGTVPIKASTIANGNLTVSGPAGQQYTAALASISPLHNAATITATYAIAAPSGGTFGAADNGTYTISIVAGSVRNVRGASAAAALLGTFAVDIPG
ncbi:MAG TPA: hypothetical protein VFC78_05545, partial [Tepidisphaeraceae bacterium]|nr:hypothetical protein [Tepidisphaeraceae bacterium]